MSLNNVTLTGSLPRAAGATATFTPSNWLTDATDQLLLPPAPQQVTLSATGTFSVSLVATDNAHLPAGWYWTVTFAGIPGVAVLSLSFFLAFANGATQDISALATLPSPVPIAPYLPVPTGTPQTGYVPQWTGPGQASAWGLPPGGPPSGAAGGVLSGTYPNPGFATTPLPESGGTMTGWLAPAVAALTDAATVAVNAALGNVFSLVFTSGVGSTRQIGNPSNPVDGQIIRFRLVQAASGGPYSATWGSAYDFGGGSAPSLTATASKTDVVAFEYVATNGLNKWCYLGAAIPQGF